MLQVPVLCKKHPVFYGWVIVAVGTVIQTLNSGVGGQGLGAFFGPLEREFGWSKTALSAGRSMMQLEGGLLGPIQGFLIDRFGPRMIMSVGSVLFGSGLVLMGMTHSFWTYYAACTVLAIGGSLSGSLALFVALNNWFRRKRTLAMALTQTGNGFAGVLVIPVLLAVMVAFGWRVAAIASGVTVWVVCLPLIRLVRIAPEPYGSIPDGEPEPPVVAENGRRRREATVAVDYTLREALRTRSFWFIGLGHGMAVMIVSAVTVHQFAHAEQDVGLLASDIALMVGVLGVATIVGRILCGIMGDRGDMRYLAAACMIGSSIALAIFAVATMLWHVLLFAILYGLFWGMRGPMMSSIRAQYFGRTAFGKIAGTSDLLTTSCSLLGPLIAGIMADLQGDYVQGFLTLAVVSGAGCFFFLFTPRPSNPRRAAVAASNIAGVSH